MMTSPPLRDPALRERLQHADPVVRLDATVSALAAAAAASTALPARAAVHEWPAFVSADEAIITALRTLGEPAPDEVAMTLAEEFASITAALIDLLALLRAALLRLVGEHDDPSQQVLLSAAAAHVAEAHRLLAVDAL
ncbi:hypothetical protein PS9374_04403 [Planomonospora sphaerica]|uniref:Uncharacterized protein n=1 Tax=Planomonospora sphaerica TaxID=161355 RepID=A0A171DIL3_9ACTN|nr:hypothetical protein [Planomonospora sphaerica]GAT68738.1 hypothetical protein PS9374_04403 [Planomonospora sphaerica]